MTLEEMKVLINSIDPKVVGDPVKEIGTIKSALYDLATQIFILMQPTIPGDPSISDEELLSKGGIVVNPK